MGVSKVLGFFTGISVLRCPFSGEEPSRVYGKGKQLGVRAEQSPIRVTSIVCLQTLVKQVPVVSFFLSTP